MQHQINSSAAERAQPAAEEHQLFVYNDLDWFAGRQIDLSDLSHFPHREELASSSRATEIYLCAYFIGHLNVINARDFTHSSPLGCLLRRHLAPDYVAQVDKSGGYLPFDESNNVYAAAVAESPDLFFKALDVRADLRTGSAKVYMTWEIQRSVDSENVNIKGLTQANWKFERDGEWRIWRVEAMRGGEVADGLGF